MAAAEDARRFPVPGDDDDNDEDDEDFSWARDIQIILQYNGTVPADAVPGDFVVDPAIWSRYPKPRPFPLNLESTWYLAACWVVLLAVHLELDTSWLLQHGYFDYFGRILYGVSVSVTIAVLTMVLYDVLGSTLGFLVRWGWDFALVFMATFWLQWDNGNRRWYLTREVFDFVSASATTIFAYSFIINLAVLKAVGLKLFGHLTVHAETITSLLSDDFLARTWAMSVLPVPDTYGGSILRALAWEVLPQLILQIWIASSLYLVVISLEVKSQEALIRGARRKDPLLSVFYVLVRGIALHLMSGTAYQLLHLCLGAVRETPIPGWIDWVPSVKYRSPFLKLVHETAIQLSGNAIAAALLYGAHVLVAFGCRLSANAFWPLWRPYVAWLTLFVEPHLRTAWPEYRRIVENDTPLKHRRYYYPALMTLSFGPEKSWPIRAAAF